MSTPFTETAGFPVNEPNLVASYSPIMIDRPGRPVPMEIKVSLPLTGTNLPVILLSHGHGATNFLASIRGYGPLVDFWAAHGFVVIQVTHLDALGLGLRDTDLPDASVFWYDRALDMHYVLDHLDELEAAVPALAGRMDRDRIVAAGHSMGGHTVSLLLGMQVQDPDDHRKKDLSDSRIKAGVILAAPGVADEYLADWLKQNYPVNLYTDFSTMTGAALVVAGDKDLNLNFSSRLSYRSDAYTQSPGGNKTLLTVHGAEHMFGGISGYDASECSDENPERVAALRALIWAYFRSQLYPEDTAWADAVALLGSPDAFGQVESK